jgi:hypothetical protein
MRDGQHFFLSTAAETGKNGELASPRECWEIKRMRDAIRDDYMLTSMEPLYRECVGIGYRDVSKVIVATRFKGDSLYRTTSWPCHVYVFTMADENIESQSEFRPTQIRMVAWAMLFRTGAEAEAHYNQFS